MTFDDDLVDVPDQIDRIVGDILRGTKRGEKP